MNQYQKNTKPINVNVVNESLSESMLAVDIDTNEPVNVTAIQDNDGKYVLRVVDAAPFMAQLIGYETVTHSVVDITSTSQVVVDANALRKYLLLYNDSETDTIYVSFDGDAVTSKGIAVPPQSAYEMTALKGNLYKGVIKAIKAGESAASLLVTEGVDS